MPLSLICASHSPLLNRVSIERPIAEAFRASIERLAEHVREYKPDYIIQFSPDHYQGFFHRLMPSFCVGLTAKSAADWDIPEGALNVPTEIAKSLVQWLRDQEFDITSSRDMVVDHGFLQIWQEMFGHLVHLPLVPIFINCIALPLPSYRRIRLLGESVGRFAVQSGDRVLIVASGGLSHDPPVPSLDTAPPEVATRLISGVPRTAEEKLLHEQRAEQAGHEAALGRGPCRPLNPEWDQAFLEAIQRGDLASFDAYTDVDVIAKAGRSANEILTWVAAFAALSAAGSFDTTVEFYHPIPAWIAGAAVASAKPQT